MRNGRLFVGAIASTALIAGCGGSSGSNALSKSQLASKTENVCKSSAKRIKAIPAPSDFATNANAAAGYLSKVDAVYKDAESQLKALTPADSVKTQWTAVTNSLGKLVSVVDDVTKKAANHDRSGLTELQQLTGLTSTLNQATQAIGANCASA